MSKNLTPLEVCVALVAPLKGLGQIAGYHEKSAYGWRHASNWRDAGDLPPRAMRKIMDHAQRNNLPLTEKHLIFGASSDDIETLLEQDHGPMAAE